MDNDLFNSAVEETQKKYPYLYNTFCRQVILRVERKNILSRNTEDSNYFSRNVALVLLDLHISPEEEPGYKSLAGRYFNSVKNRVKDKNDKNKPVKVFMEGGQLSWQF